MPQAKPQEDKEQMTTVRMPNITHTAMKLILKRYKDEKRDSAKRIGDALWEFIQEHDPDLADRARRVNNIREQYEAEFGTDDE